MYTWRIPFDPDTRRCTRNWWSPPATFRLTLAAVHGTGARQKKKTKKGADQMARPDVASFTCRRRAFRGSQSTCRVVLPMPREPRGRQPMPPWRLAPLQFSGRQTIS